MPVRLDEAVDRTIRGRAGDIPIRMFTPETVRGVFLHLHGGGWTLGSAAHQDPLLAALAHSAGVVVISVDYRLAPEHPYPVDPTTVRPRAAWLSKTRRGVRVGSTGHRRRVGRRAPRRGHCSAAGSDVMRPSVPCGELVFGAYDLSLTPSQRGVGRRNHILVRTGYPLFPIVRARPQSRENGGTRVSPLYADLNGMPPRCSRRHQGPSARRHPLHGRPVAVGGSPAELEVVAEAVHGFIAFPITVAQQELARGLAYIATAVADTASDSVD